MAIRMERKKPGLVFQLPFLLSFDNLPINVLGAFCT